MLQITFGFILLVIVKHFGKCTIFCKENSQD